MMFNKYGNYLCFQRKERWLPGRNTAFSSPKRWLSEISLSSNIASVGMKKIAHTAIIYNKKINWNKKKSKIAC